MTRKDEHVMLLFFLGITVIPVIVLSRVVTGPGFHNIIVGIVYFFAADHFVVHSANKQIERGELTHMFEDSGVYTSTKISETTRYVERKPTRREIKESERRWKEEIARLEEEALDEAVAMWDDE